MSAAVAFPPPRCCFRAACSGVECAGNPHVARQPGPLSARSDKSGYFADSLLAKFGQHAESLRVATRLRRDSVQLRNVVADKDLQEAVSVEESLGKRQPGDEFSGDINIRTLRSLLSIIDGRGFERSAHQLKFHSAFERATARVVYREDWETQRPAIMRKNLWNSCPGEVLISTPRRFGKTFSIAIFAACMALAFRLEIVIFSPARRASRKLLERVVEFIRLVGCEDRIVECQKLGLVDAAIRTL